MILDVPYYSQFKDTQSQAWQDKACGIVALKMILDFYQQHGNLTVNELYQKGLDLGGFLENVGWYHHSLANIAQTLGFSAITRNWNIQSDHLPKLKSRGFREEDLQIMRDQQLEEGLFTLKKELEAGHPMIVPLPRGFTPGGSGHLVVLIGFDGEGWVLHDPDDRERPGSRVRLNNGQFLRLWEKRAIIIYPKT